MPSAMAMCTPANTSAEQHHHDGDHVEMAEHDVLSSKVRGGAECGSSAGRPVTSARDGVHRHAEHS